MPETSVPVVDCEQQHPSLRVHDVAAAVEFYVTRLGFTAGFTWGEPPTMAGVNLGSVQMFLEHGTANPSGCSVYFVVGDADELYEFQHGQGVEMVTAPEDRPYGLRDYRVRDLNGYELGFGHHIYTAGARLPIERTDLTVRIEKRLAALMHDLAEHKHMTLSSCLEETLLHALDDVGPHTKSQLRHIAELKRKHGIDYDSHASYRWIELA